MAKIVLPLTINQVKSAQPREKMYRLADGKGLALWVFPNGLKSWRLSYTQPNNKKNTLTLGSSEHFTLAQARQWRDLNRQKLANGENIKNSKTAKSATFEHICKIWYERWLETVTLDYAEQVLRAVNANVMNYLGKMDINEIKPIHIVEALTPMETRGKLEYLRRVKSALKMIFDFAVYRGLAEYNPALMVHNSAFKAHKPKHFAALSPNQLPDLINWLENGKIEVVTKLCIYFQLLTMVRPGEAVGTTWQEIDLENKIWRIPAARMKKRREHIVPLSKLAIEILKEAYKISAHRNYVFIGRDFNNHINVETARVNLRRSGLDTTAHGLRSLASTILNESALFRFDVIESALAHVSENKVRAAYNRAQYIEERTLLLEWWSDKINNLILANQKSRI